MNNFITSPFIFQDLYVKQPIFGCTYPCIFQIVPLGFLVISAALIEKTLLSMFFDIDRILSVKKAYNDLYNIDISYTIYCNYLYFCYTINGLFYLFIGQGIQQWPTGNHPWLFVSVQME